MATDSSTHIYKARVSSLEITEVFRKSWSIYRHVVDHNYLHHAEVKENYVKHISSIHLNDKKGLTVLDLGCGDCILPSEVLSSPGIPQISEFTGVDFSAAPLAFAQAAASFPQGCKVDLVEADMTEFIKDCDSNFDIIMSNLAIHHLQSSADKGDMLKNMYKHLNPGGMLLYSDVYNSKVGRDRVETMQAWKPKIFDGYSELDIEERKTIWDHISNYDYPEDLPTVKTLLCEAGFNETSIQCVYTDEFYITIWVAHK